MTELAVFAVLLICLATLFCAVSEIQRQDDEIAELKSNLDKWLEIYEFSRRFER